jgi:hypothetical protein
MLDRQLLRGDAFEISRVAAEVFGEFSAVELDEADRNALQEIEGVGRY